MTTAYHAVAQHAPQKADSLKSIWKSKADSADAKYNETLNRLKVPGQRVDSVSKRGVHAVDSLTAKVDSLSQKIAAVDDKYIDSLNAVVTNYQTRLDKLLNRITNKSDSVTNVDRHTGKYSNMIDSLNRVDPASAKEVRALQEQIQTAQSKVLQAQSKTTTAIADRLKSFNKDAGGDTGLPQDIGLPDVKIDGIKMPELPGIKTDVPTPEVKELSSSLNTDALSIPDASLNQDILSSPDIPALDLQNQVGDQTGKLSELTSHAGQVGEDVKNIKNADLEKIQTVKEEDIIEKLPVENEMKVLKEQEQFVKDQQATLKSYKNLDAYKEKTLQRSRQMVNAQFATHGQEINQAVAKVSKYQSTAGTLLAKKGDLPKKRDPLRRLKPFERIVPGIAFQVVATSGWLVDFNPSFRYRITSYWSAGAGWNERLVIGDYPQSYSQARIFGPRLFTEVIIFKGITARIDVEEMNSPMKIGQVQDHTNRVNVWNYNAGIKKDFSFIKRITGNVQFMYTLYSTSMSYPYPGRYNVRFGFEYLNKPKIKRKK